MLHCMLPCEAPTSCCEAACKLLLLLPAGEERDVSGCSSSEEMTMHSGSSVSASAGCHSRSSAAEGADTGGASVGSRSGLNGKRMFTSPGPWPIILRYFIDFSSTVG